MGTLNAGLKKELKNNKGSFQLTVSDLLRTLRINSYYGAITEEAFSAKNHVRFNTESSRMSILKFTYSKSFGSTLMTGERKTDSGSQDEQDRIRKN